MIFTVALFLCYDRLVEKRQKKVLNQAVQSTSIVTSLFPKQIHEKLLQEEDNHHKKNKNASSSNKNYNSKLPSKFKNMMGDTSHVREQQIADLYPHCSGKFFVVVGILFYELGIL
jgi:hypothetical protein